MARNRSKRKGSNETRWSREAMGVLLAGIGILLLLSLVSYTPGDLPIKIPFRGAAAAPPCQTRWATDGTQWPP